jgi:hypothetical protein
MSTLRKSIDQRSVEHSLRENSTWDQFEPKLAALQSFTDAEMLVFRAPPEGSPGRKFYSNLGFFLQRFSVPDGASRAELHLYIGFIRRIAANIKLGEENRIIRDLENASRERWW